MLGQNIRAEVEEDGDDLDEPSESLELSSHGKARQLCGVYGPKECLKATFAAKEMSSVSSIDSLGDSDASWH